MREGFRGESSFGCTLDPLLIPSHLPSLFIAEELLIARAHVLMDLRRVKGCQYKYSGHVVNFMQNTAKIIHRLPSLSSELQMLVLKPSSSSIKESNVSLSFRETFRVRRKNVETWLEFLIQNHSLNKIIRINFEKLEQLPEDDSIWDQLSTADDPLQKDKTNQISEPPSKPIKPTTSRDMIRIFYGVIKDTTQNKARKA
jgi:hypothetical protein